LEQHFQEASLPVKRHFSDHDDDDWHDALQRGPAPVVVSQAKSALQDEQRNHPATLNVWDQFRQGEAEGVIGDRTATINAWLREMLDRLKHTKDS
jgi:hypothetical protein